MSYKIPIRAYRHQAIGFYISRVMCFGVFYLKVGDSAFIWTPIQPKWQTYWESGNVLYNKKCSLSHSIEPSTPMEFLLFTGEDLKDTICKCLGYKLNDFVIKTRKVRHD